MLITPREGAVHKPDTGDPAWSFKYDGQLHRIINENGTPIPLDLDLGHHALNYFNKQGEGRGDLVSLVDYDIRQGELTLNLKEAAYPCPLCHEKFDGMAEMSAHVPGCAAALHSQQPPPPATRPKAKAKTDDAEIA